MYDLIKKKRDNNALTDEEISFMIDGYVKGEIPDYQMSAMMMAIFFNGMDKKETVSLTLKMRDSGDVLDLSDIEGVKVDKHSSGGVGDKTTLALAPLVASCGVKVVKMSGRGLGHTGGTIDKLESFPGFSVSLSPEQMKEQAKQIGIVVAGQTSDIAPADKKLYALRDVTATVDNISLIASSIMSKKLASGADVIVLDVKTGSGAFMVKEEDACKLAEAMKDIGTDAGRKVVAMVTDMDEPLGNAVGNILEVKEAIDTLNGKGPEDFTQLVFALASKMLILAGKCKNDEEALDLLKSKIDDKSALNKLAQFVEAQGGDPSYVFDPDKFEKASFTRELKADRDGYISRIECAEVGMSSLMLGGGRESLDDEIDLSVGIILNKKKGQKVSKGDVLATLYANDEDKADQALIRLKNAYEISDSYNEKKILIKKIFE
ncbi:MAG TPA: pyrimidine-nucleoside phosphorylase [Lachnospiraceae bacterium]|nr:pyrimidine-nucleoside phosphorylase [Lachnospiraceae bacterium]